MRDTISLSKEEQRRGRILAHLVSGDLAIEQAAAWLGVSARTLDRMQKDDAIPFVTVGKRRKYLLHDLEAFLQSRRSV